MSNYAEKDYLRAVITAAEDAIESAKNGADVMETAREVAENSWWTTTTLGAVHCLMYSENHSVYLDTEFPIDASKGFHNICTQLAPETMYADIKAKITDLDGTI